MENIEYSSKNEKEKGRIKIIKVNKSLNDSKKSNIINMDINEDLL